MKGLTKREHFAAMAMQGLLAHHGAYDDRYDRSFRTLDDGQMPDVEGYVPEEYSTDELAEAALAYADEIIKRLAESEK